MSMLLVLYIIILCIIFIMYVMKVNFYRHIKSHLIDDDYIFIKSNPKKYKVIEGKRRELPNIYPFYDMDSWSSLEQEVLVSGHDKMFISNYKGILYRVELFKLTALKNFYLLVRITKISPDTVKQLNYLVDNSPFHFLVIEENAKVINTNDFEFQDLKETCSNLEMLNIAMQSKVPITADIQFGSRWFSMHFVRQGDYWANKPYWLVLSTEITKLVEAKNQIAEKSKILDILKTGISTLISDEALTKNIRHLLYELSTSLKTQRAYIYKVVNGNLVLQHEWKEISLGHDAEEELYRNLNEVEKHFKDDNVVVISRKDLDDDRCATWNKYNLCNRIIMPLFMREHKLWGILGFDTYGKEREWTEEQLKIIRLIGVTLDAIIILGVDEKQIKDLNIQINSILSTLSSQMSSEIERTKQMNALLKRDETQNQEDLTE